MRFILNEIKNYARSSVKTNMLNYINLFFIWQEKHNCDNWLKNKIGKVHLKNTRAQKDYNYNDGAVGHN